MMGDLIETAVKPIAKALKMDCLDQSGQLKPESTCAERRDGMNRFFFYAQKKLNELLFGNNNNNMSTPMNTPPNKVTPSPVRSGPPALSRSTFKLGLERVDNGGWIVNVIQGQTMRAQNVYKDDADLLQAVPGLIKPPLITP